MVLALSSSHWSDSRYTLPAAIFVMRAKIPQAMKRIKRIITKFMRVEKQRKLHTPKLQMSVSEVLKGMLLVCFTYPQSGQNKSSFVICITQAFTLPKRSLSQSLRVVRLTSYMPILWASRWSSAISVEGQASTWPSRQRSSRRSAASRTLSPSSSTAESPTATNLVRSPSSCLISSQLVSALIILYQFLLFDSFYTQFQKVNPFQLFIPFSVSSDDRESIFLVYLRFRMLNSEIVFSIFFFSLQLDSWLEYFPSEPLEHYISFCLLLKCRILLSRFFCIPTNISQSKNQRTFLIISKFTETPCKTYIFDIIICKLTNIIKNAFFKYPKLPTKLMSIMFFIQLLNSSCEILKRFQEEIYCNNQCSISLLQIINYIQDKIKFVNFNNKMNRDYLRGPQRQSNHVAEFGTKKNIENQGTQAQSSRRGSLKHPTNEDKDSRIMQIRRKYEDAPLKTLSSNLSRVSQNRSTQKDEEILKKLQNIKNELQAIPNWEKYAKSFFFDENAESSRISPREFSSKKHEAIKRKQIERPRVLSREVIGKESKTFQIRQASSINQSDEKPYHGKIERKAYINEFSLEHKEQRENFEKEVQFIPNSKTRQRERQQRTEGVDKRIYEIQSRIKDFERKKKTLNIDFVPFEAKISHNRSTSNLQRGGYLRKDHSYKQQQENSYAKKDLSKPPKSRKNSSASKKIPFITEYSRQMSKNDCEMISPTFAGIREIKSSKFDFKEYKGNADNHLPSRQSEQIHRHYLPINKSSTSNMKNDQKLEREFSQTSFRAYNDSESQKYVFDCEREKQTEERMQRRKKRINQYDFKAKNYTIQNLVAAFSEQAKLDETFRNNKLWFAACKNDKKWQKLQSLVELEGISLSLQELETQFEVAEQEDNPFFSVGSQTSDIETVAKSFANSDKHWTKAILRKFSRGALQDDGFRNQMIDLDKKGFLVLEDFVRFLNMETGTFFRNRDIFCIFKRLAQGNEKIKFETFLSQIAH